MASAYMLRSFVAIVSFITGFYLQGKYAQSDRFSFREALGALLMLISLCLLFVFPW